MATMMRKVRGGTSTHYPAEFVELLEDLKFAKTSTEEIVDSLIDIVSQYNGSNSLNRYEKMGEVFSAYASKLTDQEAMEAIASAKPGFEAIGRIYRIFSTEVQEQVISKFQFCLKNEYKAMHEEIKKLDKARNEFDNANDKVRRKPDDGEAQTRKDNAEAVHDAQIAAVKQTLAQLEDYYDMMADTLKDFDALLLKVLADEKFEMDKLTNANKF